MQTHFDKNSAAKANTRKCTDRTRTNIHIRISQENMKNARNQQ